MAKPLLEIWIRDHAAEVDGRRGFEVVAELEPGDRSARGVFDDSDVRTDVVEAAVAGIEAGTYGAADTVALGQRIFTSLFTGSIHRLYDESVEPRIRLFVDPASARVIPWEIMHDGTRFLSVGMPFSRGIKTVSAAAPLTVAGPLRVLVAEAFPAGVDELDARAEAADIIEALSEISTDRVSVTVLTGTTVENLINALREANANASPFHVLHFIGHGLRRDASFVLLFEEATARASDGRPRAKAIGPAELVNIVCRDSDANGEPDVKLVFLNACRSVQFATIEAVDSFAPRLLGAGIPALVGMQNSVSDNAARAFAHDFYTALGDRVPIDEALRDARTTASAKEPQLVADLAVPVLYLRSDTGELFAPAGERGYVTPRPYERLRQFAKWVGGVLGGAIVLSIAIFLLSRGHSWYCESDIRPVSWTCPAASTMTPTRFNVAIAEFDADSGSDRQFAKSLSETLFENLEGSILEFGFTDVWGPDETGAVRGTTAEEREKAANERADEINADMIIYGRLEPSGTRAELVPEFYVNDRRSEFARANASELTGGYQFGAGEAVDPSDLASANQDFKLAMEGRVRAMAAFVQGLAYYARSPARLDEALASFQDAEAIEQWRPDEGREILYMFIGNTEGKLATKYPPDSPERQAALERAREAYDASLEIDPDYARAMLGTAEVQFATSGGLACEPGHVDESGMSLAESTYRQAQQARNAPVHADIDLKGDYGIARIYLCERLAGIDPDGDPDPLFREIIDAHQQGNERVAAIAGESEGWLGALAGHDGRVDDAIQHYLDAAQRLESLGLDDRAAIMRDLAAYYQSCDGSTCPPTANT